MTISNQTRVAGTDKQKEVSMRSKVVLCVLIALLVPGVLFARGEQEGGAADGEPVPVMIWLPGGAQQDQEAVNEAAREYAADRIGAWPEVEFIGWGEWGDKKQLAIQAGEEMDIVFTASWDNFFQEVARNAWLPLDDLIDENAPSLRQTVGFFLDGPVVDGQIYAVPTVKEGAESRQWFFNAELADRYNVPVDQIVEPSDLDPYLAQIAANEPDVIPYLIDGVSELPNYRNYFNTIGMGGDWHYVEGEGVKYIWNREITWDRAEKMHEWYLAGYFQPEVEDVGGTPEADRYWETGNWFAYSHVGHPGKVGELEGRWGYEIYGTGPLQQPLVTTEILMGAMMSISRTSAKAPQAIRVLELMNADQEFNNLLNYGIEGVHYEFVDESAGVIDPVPDSGYSPNMQWALQNQFLTYLLPTEDPQKWERYEAFNESARLAPTVGFTADQAPVRTQLASIANVKEQYNELLTRGLEDPAELRDEFMAALEQAGMLEVEAELTAQFEAWQAAQ